MNLSSPRHLLPLFTNRQLIRGPEFLSLIPDTSPTRESHDRRVYHLLARAVRLRILDRTREVRYDERTPCFIYTVHREDAPSPVALRHEQEIDCFRQRLIHAGLEVVDWRQRRLQSAKVNPDAAFGLAFGDDVHGFFYDPIKQRNNHHTYDKCKGYYDLFDTDECERLYGFRKFRVLFTHTTDERVGGFLRWIKQSPYTHRMFWLSTETEIHTDIGGPIWHTSKDVQFDGRHMVVATRHSFNDLKQVEGA